MNDRFKFRAWLMDEKRYSENINLFNCCNDTTYDVEEYDNKGSHYTMYRADEVVLEQCTGLNDKNGKLIYENDLIKIDDDVAVIKWSDYYARFMLESSEDNFDFETTYAEECEVIGNIHENADLIKVGGK